MLVGCYTRPSRVYAEAEAWGQRTNCVIRLNGWTLRKHVAALRCYDFTKDVMLQLQLLRLFCGGPCRKGKRSVYNQCKWKISPPPFANTLKSYYMTLKWLLCFSHPVDVNKRDGSSPECISEIGPRWIQRCLWLREMNCPVPLHGAYITERRAVDPGGINRKASHYLDD